MNTSTKGCLKLPDEKFKSIVTLNSFLFVSFVHELVCLNNFEQVFLFLMENKFTETSQKQ